ncbi:MAG: PRC-barrel domain-containing protein [Proteobacteria bacterium]|nr:PRC-barrel domain-containing protein [Pseudomonadota bacterium]
MNTEIVRAEDVIGVEVANQQGENLGEIKELMLDKINGQVAYVVLSFGGFLGMGNKLFALPWHMFSYNQPQGKFIINVAKDKLEKSPGFDKDHWPEMSSPYWTQTVNQYYARHH